MCCCFVSIRAWQKLSKSSSGRRCNASMTASFCLYGSTIHYSTNYPIFSLSLSFNGHFPRDVCTNTHTTLKHYLFLRFNGHFPGETGLASVYWSKGWWKRWWQLDYWSYKSCKAPVKSSPPTNQHPVFYRPDALPVAQPTVSKHWREKYNASTTASSWLYGSTIHYSTNHPIFCKKNYCYSSLAVSFDLHGVILVLYVCILNVYAIQFYNRKAGNKISLLLRRRRLLRLLTDMLLACCRVKMFLLISNTWALLQTAVEIGDSLRRGTI